MYVRFIVLAIIALCTYSYIPSLPLLLAILRIVSHVVFISA